MEIVLYLSSAEKNRVDKSAFLTKVLELEGSLRDSASLLNPTILLELPFDLIEVQAGGEDIQADDEDVVVSDIENVLRFNYVHIPTFNRYYYVNDVRAEYGYNATDSTRLYSVSLSVDPLMSHREGILSNEAMVERNQFDFDEKLEDPELTYSDEIEVTEEPLENGFPFNKSFTEGTTFIALTTYVTKLGITRLILRPELGDTYDERVRNLFGTETTIPGAFDEVFPSYMPGRADPSFFTITYLLTYWELLGFLSNIQENDKTFIKSVVSFPFSLPMWVENLGYSKKIPIYLGDDTRDSSLKVLLSNSCGLSNYVLVGIHRFPELNFSNKSPVAEWTLYVPFMGEIPVPFEKWSNKSMKVITHFSLTDGHGVLRLTDDDGSIVEEHEIEIGSLIPVDSTNAVSVRNNNISNGISTSLGVISSVASFALGIGMMNPVAILGGAVGFGKSIGSSVSKALSNVPTASVSKVPANLRYGMPSEAKVRKYSKTLLISDLSAFRALRGAPLRKVRRLSALTGFTIVSSIHLENVNAFSPELDAIESFLMRGVIL